MDSGVWKEGGKEGRKELEKVKMARVPQMVTMQRERERPDSCADTVLPSLVCRIWKNHTHKKGRITEVSSSHLI